MRYAVKLPAANQLTMLLCSFRREKKSKSATAENMRMGLVYEAKMGMSMPM